MDDHKTVTATFTRILPIIERIVLRGGGTPLNDSQVQEAIMIAVPWSDLMDECFPGQNIPVIVGIENPIITDARGLIYSVGRADELLAGAGYPDGFRLAWYVEQDNRVASLAGRVEEHLAKIDVVLEQVPDLAQFEVRLAVGETVLGLFWE